MSVLVTEDVLDGRMICFNLERGIRKSLQYAAIGFVIPATVTGLIWLYRFAFLDIHPRDRELDLALLPDVVFGPSIGIALLFGLSAFASFAPNGGMAFTRSLIVVAGATLIAVFATQPRVRRKTTHPDPNAWLEVAIPIAVAVVATLAILIYAKRDTPPNVSVGHSAEQ